MKIQSTYNAPSKPSFNDWAREIRKAIIELTKPKK